MAVGKSPKVAISSPAQYCGLRAEAGHQDPRAAGEARGAAEVVRGAQPGVGASVAGLAHEIFLKLLKAKREVPGAAERRLRRARTGQQHVLCRVLGQLRVEGLRGCKPRGPPYEVRCRLRAVCSAAQAVRDGGRPLPVAGQGAGLGVSRQVVLNKAGSAVPLVPLRKAHVLVRGLCGSAEAFLGMQGRVLQGPRVGVLTGLYKIVQVEVACDKRGGLAVRSALGSPPPAQSAGAG